MAEKKITHSDFFGDDLFLAQIKSVELFDEKIKENIKTLEALSSGLKKLKIDGVSSVEGLVKAETALTQTIKADVEVRKKQRETQIEANKLSKQLKQSTDEEVKAKLKYQKATKAQKDELKDLLILEDKEAGTLEKLAAQNRKLARERAKLNIDTDKGRKRLKEINAQLDKNNKKIKDNSDALKKQKMNVGNYTNSIKEAAGASGLFGGVLGKLSQIQATANALLKTSSAETAANTAQKGANTTATANMTAAQRAFNSASLKGTKALKLFKTALIGTGIGALVIAIGALVSYFTRMQDGADAISTKMAGLTAAIDVLIDRLSQIGGGLLALFKAIPGVIGNVGRKIKLFFLEMLDGVTVFGKSITDNKAEIAELKKEIEDNSGVSAALSQIADAFKGIGDEIKADTKAAMDLRAANILLTREAKLFEAEQAAAITRTKELTGIVLNKLNADKERLAAVREIQAIELDVSEKQLALQERQLAASLDSLSADSQRLELGPEQLKFINQIREGTIGAADAVQKAADFTLSSAAGEQALFDVVDKVVKLEQARQSLLDKRATTEKRIGSITREIAQKESKSLLQQARFEQLIAKDKEKSTQERINAILKVEEATVNSSKKLLAANIINAEEFAFVELTERKKAEAAIAKLRADDIKAEEAKQKVLTSIRQERLKGQIDALSAEEEKNEDTIDAIFDLRITKMTEAAEFEKSIGQKTADEKKLIQEKLNNDLAALERERADAQKALADKQAAEAEERRKEELEKENEKLDRITEAYNRAADYRSSLLDRQVDETSENLRLQEERQAKGQKNNLAEAQKANAEALQEQREFMERRANYEKFLAYLKYVNEYISENPDDAPIKALGQVLLTEAIGEGLLGFEQGTEEGVEKDLGGRGKALTKGIDRYLGVTKSGNLFKFGGGEKIFDEGLSSELLGTGLNNKEVTKLAVDFSNGLLSYRSAERTQEHRPQPSVNPELLGAEMARALSSATIIVNTDEQGKKTRADVYFNGRKMRTSAPPKMRLPNG